MKPLLRKRARRDYRWILTEWWEAMREGSRRRWDTRRTICALGLHWPIRWSEAAIPMQYDPPHPPEPGWCCDWCGELRYPYRAVFWPLQDWWRHPLFMWRERHGK